MNAVRSGLGGASTMIYVGCGRPAQSFLLKRSRQKQTLCAPADVDARHVTRYAFGVIKTFADGQTEELFRTGKAKKVPADVARRALRKLEAVHAALQLTDLRVPSGNRLHPLKGARAGQHAIAVNDQWRICFRFVDGDAYDVEFCDYH